MVNKCQSCGMPMEKLDDYGGGRSGNPYCKYCTDDQGNLLPREVVREKMIRFQMKSLNLSREQAEVEIDRFLQTKPAWIQSEMPSSPPPGPGAVSPSVPSFQPPGPGDQPTPFPTTPPPVSSFPQPPSAGADFPGSSSPTGLPAQPADQSDQAPSEAKKDFGVSGGISSPPASPPPPVPSAPITGMPLGEDQSESPVSAPLGSQGVGSDSLPPSSAFPMETEEPEDQTEPEEDQASGLTPPPAGSFGFEGRKSG